MKMYCTASTELKGSILLHNSSEFIDGRFSFPVIGNLNAVLQNPIIDNTKIKLEFPETSEKILNSSSYAESKSCAEFICKYLNGDFENDENFTDLKKQDASQIRDFVHKILLDDSSERKALLRYIEYAKKTPCTLLNLTVRQRRIYPTINGELIVADTYEFENQVGFFKFLLRHSIENNIMIRICPNCSRYFVPFRSDSFYCQGKAPQAINGKYFSCARYIINKKTVEKRQSGAPKLYQQIYNRLLNRVKREKRTKEKNYNQKLLEQFLSEAMIMREKIDKGELSADEYIAWLEDVKARKGNVNID